MVWNIHFLFNGEIERALIPYQQVIKFHQGSLQIGTHSGKELKK